MIAKREKQSGDENQDPKKLVASHFQEVKDLMNNV
jgi:hypothetical protein